MPGRATKDLKRAYLILIFVTTLAAYLGAMHFLGSRRAIEMGNVIMLSLASGIIVSYAPSVWSDLKLARLDRAAVLGVGIFASWFAIMFRTGASIVWRLFDKPVDWLDSGLWGWHLQLSSFAAICHLVAPSALAGRVPSYQWVRIGIMVAAGVFCGVAVIVSNLD